MTGSLPHWTNDTARVLRAAAALLSIEFGCLVLAAGATPMAAIMLHACCCAAFAWLAFRPGAARTPAAATVRVVALTAPFLGPIAASAGLVILAVIAVAHDPVANASMWHEHLFPNLAVDELTERTEEISRQSGNGGADEIESFFDVLRWGTLPEKEHVLSLISRSFRPEFAPVLRAGLAVDDLGLRAQAAAGLSMLETRISARLGNLQEAFRDAGPEERSTAAIDLALALSDAAHTGLYDEARNTEMRREIVSILTTCAGPVDPRINTMLGRTLIQLGEFDQAVETLSGVADATGSGEAAFDWLLEGVFRQGDYRRIGSLVEGRAESVRSLVQQDGPLAPALRFWGAAA